MSIRSRELLVGLVFLLLGGVGLALSLRYSLGTPRQIGPGAFPALLAGILCILGLAQCVVALRQPTTSTGETVRFRPIIAVTVAVIAFGLLVDNVGAVVSLLLSAIIASCADGRPNPKSVVIVYAVILALTVGLVRLIGLQLPMFWW